MIFTQYYLDCLSQASYLIADETTKQAVVVDPRRDVAEYLADARARDLTIVGVIDTHFHADFLAGHLELAAATGAWIGFGQRAEADYPIRKLADGERIPLGDGMAVDRDRFVERANEIAGYGRHALDQRHAGRKVAARYDQRAHRVWNPNQYRIAATNRRSWLRPIEPDRHAGGDVPDKTRCRMADRDNISESGGEGDYEGEAHGLHGASTSS